MVTSVSAVPCRPLPEFVGAASPLILYVWGSYIHMLYHDLDDRSNKSTCQVQAEAIVAGWIQNSALIRQLSGPGTCTAEVIMAGYTYHQVNSLLNELPDPGEQHR